MALGPDVKFPRSRAYDRNLSVYDSLREVSEEKGSKNSREGRRRSKDVVLAI